MFSKIKICALVDLARIQDDTTGDTSLVVSSGKIIVCDKDLVGVQTQMLAQSQNMIFSWTIEIDRMYYIEQKYIYIDDQVYEVKNIAKGSKPNLCKLNVVENDDTQIYAIIKEWYDANVQ